MISSHVCAELLGSVKESLKCVALLNRALYDEQECGAYFANAEISTTESICSQSTTSCSQSTRDSIISSSSSTSIPRYLSVKPIARMYIQYLNKMLENDSVEVPNDMWAEWDYALQYNLVKDNAPDVETSSKQTDCEDDDDDDDLNSNEHDNNNQNDTDVTDLVD